MQVAKIKRAEIKNIFSPNTPAVVIPKGIVELTSACYFLSIKRFTFLVGKCLQGASISLCKID